MRHLDQILLILLVSFSTTFCYSQKSKINLLEYLYSNENNKCIQYFDSLTKTQFYLNPSTIPTFPRGMQNFEKFISKNSKFDFNKADAQGKIIFEFIVNENGEVKNIKILQSLTEEFDNELIKTL